MGKGWQAVQAEPDESNQDGEQEWVCWKVSFPWLRFSDDARTTDEGELDI